MSKLRRARATANCPWGRGDTADSDGECQFVQPGDRFAVWNAGAPATWSMQEAHDIVASLLLDGYPAKWPRKPTGTSREKGTP